MLAAIFVYSGVQVLRSPEGHAKAAEPVLDAAKPVLDPVLDKAVEVAPIDSRPDAEMLVKIDAGVKIAAGTLLALGKFPRLASTALAASVVPTTLAAHRFWEEQDATTRAQQRIHFFKNLSMLGGLILAAVDTEGRPGLAWRARHAGHHAAAGTRRTRRAAKRNARLAAHDARHALPV